MSQTIMYTKTDESPLMATNSLFPIYQTFLSKVGVNLALTDISLAGRILARFSEYLTEEQRVVDALSELGGLVKRPEATVMKLPNISASVPQLHACIAELNAQGFAVPAYPDEPKTDEDFEVQARYNKIKGSAVNPVLREGNSDRRAPKAVKRYAQANPHWMGAWSSESKSHVAHMSNGDFYCTEQAVEFDTEDDVSIRHISLNGTETVLKASVPVRAGEVIDSSAMSLAQLRSFFEEEIAKAKEEGVLFSVHLKATMMKVSDPIIFGAVVYAYFKDLFDKHAELFTELNISPNNGMGDLERKIQDLPADKRAEIEVDIDAIYAVQPELAYVDSDNGITNLHVPSHVIIDASVPAAIRSSGKMWGRDGVQKDTKFTIPDRCYAGIYQVVIDFCKQHGAFDVTTMGSVSNVGLMAQKAQEYGSHDKTFQLESDGCVQVVNRSGAVVMEHTVEAGDIWRMCQVKDAPIEDWVGLAVRRSRITGTPVVFWLDENRAQDAQLIQKVQEYLPNHDTDGLDIFVLNPADAMQYTLERCKDGLDTISATGNVLRDYLTDLFPILELGTSAKMLSVVPLMNGGGLFETGAGGTAPRLLDQFFAENHLSWDSLGEFLAMEAALEHLSRSAENAKAGVLSECLGDAIEQVLMNGKSPSPKVHELDNRGSHFDLCLYWAQQGANQSQNSDLAEIFKPFAEQLTAAEKEIVHEINAVQGQPVQLKGYYQPSDVELFELMRPSKTLNAILDGFAG